MICWWSFSILRNEKNKTIFAKKGEKVIVVNKHVIQDIARYL
jgi:hypothetical protein